MSSKKTNKTKKTKVKVTVNEEDDDDDSEVDEELEVDVRQPRRRRRAPPQRALPQQQIIINNNTGGGWGGYAREESYCGIFSWLIALFTGFWCIAFCPIDKRMVTYIPFWQRRPVQVGASFLAALFVIGFVGAIQDRKYYS